MNNTTTTVNMQIGMALSSIAESQKKMAEATEKMMKMMEIILTSEATKSLIAASEEDYALRNLQQELVEVFK